MKTVIDLFEKINIRGRCIWFLAGHLIELLLRAPLSALRGAGLPGQESNVTDCQRQSRCAEGGRSVDRCARPGRTTPMRL